MRPFLSAFFSSGCRPFFLLAALHAVLVMILFLLWIGVHFAGADFIWMSIAVPAHIWHAHEMLFGFGIAAYAGILLTALPNRTNAKPVKGWALGVLVALWCTGRIGNGFSASIPGYLVAGMDLGFIPVFCAFLAVALIKSGSRRSLALIPLTLGFLIAQSIYHLSVLDIVEIDIATGHLLAVNLFAFLIAIVGGRLVPVFAAHTLRQTEDVRFSIKRRVSTQSGAFLVAALAVADWLAPGSAFTGWLAAAAAAANGIGLLGGHGYRIPGSTRLTMLDVGFAWLVVGLSLKAVVILTGLLSPATAMHALTAGAFGTTILAVMSGTARDHTDRPPFVRKATVAAYVCLFAGTLLRVAVPPLLPPWYSEGIMLAGILWCAAFAIFAVSYFPILTEPRPDTGK